MNGAPDTIKFLVRDLRPVRRLAPPVLRAGLWLCAVAAAAGLAVVLFGQPAELAARLSSPALAVEFAATLLTGIAAVFAAFQLSVPDRSRAWVLLPIAPLAVWLAASGSQCWHALSTSEGMHAEPGCLFFIVGAGAPLTLSLLYLLRRAAPLEPLRTALLGALGAGALTAAVLQFFHPFDVTFPDLGFHAAAVGVLLALAAAAAQLTRPSKGF